MMGRTLTALYQTRAKAEDAAQQLNDVGVAVGGINIHEAKSFGGSAGSPSSGLLAGLKGVFGSHEDRHAYAEGIGRGHVLLSAKVDDLRTDEAIRVLEGSHAIDFDKALADWMHAPPAPTARPSSVADEDTLPIDEESPIGGRREVERGGVRVRSYVVETP